MNQPSTWHNMKRLTGLFWFTLSQVFWLKKRKTGAATARADSVFNIMTVKGASFCFNLKHTAGVFGQEVVWYPNIRIFMHHYLEMHVLFLCGVGLTLYHHIKVVNRKLLFSYSDQVWNHRTCPNLQSRDRTWTSLSITVVCHTFIFRFGHMQLHGTAFHTLSCGYHQKNIPELFFVQFIIHDHWFRFYFDSFFFGWQLLFALCTAKTEI